MSHAVGNLFDRFAGTKAPAPVAEILRFLRQTGSVARTCEKFGVRRSELAAMRADAVSAERRARRPPEPSGPVVGPHHGSRNYSTSEHSSAPYRSRE